MGIIIPKMGKSAKKPVSLASALFSGVQLRLLSLLIGHPNETFSISEIIKLVRSGSGAVQRELIKLTKAGILTSISHGNRKLYQANKQAPIFEELSGIILKTTGLVEPIRTALKQFKNQMRFAFVFGSVAKGTDTASSDVDVMIVGNDLSYGEIFRALQRAEKEIHRPINPNIMTPADWNSALSTDNSFFKKITQQPKVFIVGSEHDIRGA